MDTPEKYKSTNVKGQNGYITLIAIAFIAVATMTLTALNSRIMQFSKLHSLSLQDQSLSVRAGEALELGMRRMGSLVDELDADETGFTLPAGISDTDLSTDRTKCLNSIPEFDSSTATSYLAGSRLSYNKIDSRFFIRDLSAGSTPRKFGIYGCALRGSRVKRFMAEWSFDATDDGAFTLERTRRF